MRILFFGSFPDYQMQLANALCKKEGVESIFLASAIPGDVIGTVDKKLILHLPVVKNPAIHPANFLSLLNLFKTISKHNPDVVHLQLGNGRMVNLLIFMYCKMIKRYPVVVTFHDVKLHPGEESRWSQFLRYLIRKNANEIIVHGEALKEEMIKEYSLPDNKVHAIQFGEHEVAPFRRYYRDDIIEKGNLVLFFGRIVEYKGLEYLIKAEPTIVREVGGAKIVIAGARDSFLKYENMIGDRKESFIIHNYHISYKEAAELFQECSVVVLPYTEASQSGVIPTAYGFMKPVVVTNVGSIPNVVDEGITGFIVPPKDPQAIADAVVKLLKNEGLRKQMGQNAYKKLKKDFAWDKIVEDTSEIYSLSIKNVKHNA